jgi:hypothetical protein
MAVGEIEYIRAKCGSYLIFSTRSRFSIREVWREGDLEKNPIKLEIYNYVLSR